MPSSLPKTISNAAKMIYLSIVLGIVNPIISELITDVENFSNHINLSIILISTTILVILGYNINLGKNWARIVFTGLGGLGLLISPLIIPDTFRLNPIIGILSLTQVILQGLAIVFLFKFESRTWYKK